MTERRLPAEAAIQFLSLGFVLTRETADIRIAAARKAGATEAECAEALAAWEQMRADDVQQIESQPTPARCLCSHARHRGRCPITVCGCSRQRDDTRRFMDADRYDPFPDPIDRSIQ